MKFLFSDLEKNLALEGKPYIYSVGMKTHRFSYDTLIGIKLYFGRVCAICLWWRVELTKLIVVKTVEITPGKLIFNKKILNKFKKQKQQYPCLGNQTIPSNV